MPRILAVVVLYFPANPIAAILESFKHEVDDILIIDNTENNTGLAKALNLGLKKAIDENFEWLLTMDQDSVFVNFRKLKNVAFDSEKNIAIVSPFHKTQKDKIAPHTGAEEVMITMTSGCLVRVNPAFFFDEKLFIDSVDNEYCLRLRRHNYKIIRVNDVVLHHQLGTLKKSWLGFSTIIHPAWRRYFITRNMIYVMRKYPEFRSFGMKELAKSFMLILLLEDDKINKLKEMIRGFRTSRL